ncbi:MAG: GNAT family N-acetyltransferase [Bacteroidales bacterium]|nr:GNAT family N-acetyltransferase [Bacteroidales bacterium]
MSFKILTLNDSEEWNNLLAKLPAEQQDIYYTPEYYSLYENYGDGKAMCFVFEKDGDIALYPFLINSVNTLGYDLDKEYYDIQGAYGYNGVVTSSYDTHFINNFYNAYNEYCRKKNIIADFTRFHPLIENHLFSQSFYSVLFDRAIVYIDVDNPEDKLWSALQTTTRKQIRRCYNRYNFQVEILENKNYNLEAFEEIYKESMARVNSNEYLYFNHKYFEQLLELPNTIQYIVSTDSCPISTIIAMKGSKILHGHLGGTLTEYLTYSPSSMLYWEMIKTAKKENLNYVHVGGGNTTNKDDKLLAFKKHFSDTMSDFCIGKKIHNQTIFDAVVSQWKHKHPESYKQHSNKLLGYREI